MKLETLFHGIGKPYSYFPGLASKLGGVKPAVLLCCIVWRDRDWKDGKVRKTFEQIRSETGLTEREFLSACKDLKKLGVLKTEYLRLEHITEFEVDLEKLDDIVKAPDKSSDAGHQTNRPVASDETYDRSLSLEKSEKKEARAAASPNGEQKPNPKPSPPTIVDNFHPEMRLASALAAMARELPVKVVWPKIEPKIERWLEDQEADIGLEAYRTEWRDWVIGEVTEGINPHPVAFAKHMQRGRSYSKGNASRARGNGYEKREPPQDESHLPTPDDQMWINKGLPVNAKERAKVLAKRFKEDRTPEKLKQMWDIVNRAREKSKATKL